MKVGILGSGDVGQALAEGFLKHGHSVKVGTRTPAKLADWAGKNPKGTVGSFAEAAAFAELVILAVHGTATGDVLRSAGAPNIKGKTVIDATNPIEDAPPLNGVLKFFTNVNESLMERLQTEFPDAAFVKAFNSVGSSLMVNPDFGSEKPTMFICGNDGTAKASVGTVLGQFGWEVADMGGVEAARAIEPLCILWCIPGFLRNEWTHAFRLLRK